MKLTGKCLDAFRNYAYNNTVTIDSSNKLYVNALIIEFFDSVGIKIIITPTMFIDQWHCDIFGWSNCEVLNLESRTEATNAAIEKANIIYNEN